MRTTATRVTRGYDAGRKVKGRKRHPVVDTLVLLLKVAVQAADVQDRDGARQVLHRLRVVWADSGYRGLQLGDRVRRQGGWVLVIVRRDPAAQGFEVVPERWIVERALAWLGRRRRLSKDYEGRTVSAEAWIRIAMVRFMLKRLASH